MADLKAFSPTAWKAFTEKFPQDTAILVDTLPTAPSQAGQVRFNRADSSWYKSETDGAGFKWTKIASESSGSDSVFVLVNSASDNIYDQIKDFTVAVVAVAAQFTESEYTFIPGTKFLFAKHPDADMYLQVGYEYAQFTADGVSQMSWALCAPITPDNTGLQGGGTIPIVLTEATPTKDSTNVVTSGGMYNVLQNILRHSILHFDTVAELPSDTSTYPLTTGSRAYVTGTNQFYSATVTGNAVAWTALEYYLTTTKTNLKGTATGSAITITSTGA